MSKDKKSNSLHILCPHCGTEFEIADKKAAKHGMEPKDGTYFLIPKTIQNREGKTIDMAMLYPSIMESLKRTTVLDTDPTDRHPNTWNLADAIKNKNVLDAIAETPLVQESRIDPVENMIQTSGDIKNHHLYRRWIMAQTLTHIDDYDKHFVSQSPYRYQWETTLQEFKAIAALQRDNDPELTERLRFYNAEMLKSMCEDYLKKIEAYIKKRINAKKCHVYVTTDGKKEKIYYTIIPHAKTKYSYGIVHDTDTRKDLGALGLSVYMARLRETIQNNLLDIIQDGDTPDMDYTKVYQGLKTIVKEIPISIKLTKSKAWKNAFKGTGAYYTMQNLIRFHNCTFEYKCDFKYNYQEPLKYQYDSHGPVDTLSPAARKHQNLAYLDSKTSQYKGEYYKLFALMKEFVKENNFDYREFHNTLES